MITKPPLRARVTYAWGAWWFRLQTCPEFVEHTCPRKYPTAAMAADAARRELAIRTESDPGRRALMRLGILPIPTRPRYALAN